MIGTDKNEVKVLPVRGPFTPVIVTGGASGIGKATCFALAEHQRPVSVWDIQGQKARDVAAEVTSRYGVKADAQEVDLRDPAAMEVALQHTLSYHGTIGGLAYVAGVSIPGAFASVATSEWDNTIETNLKGPAILSRLVVPELKKSGAASAICIVSSTTAFQSYGQLAVYSASKAGVVGLMRALALALARDCGIRVNAICPGATATPMLEASLKAVADPEGTKAMIAAQIPLSRIGQPEEMAAAIRFLLSGDASYITGATLLVDGGMTAGY